MILVSERTAASIVPAKAARTDSAARQHHDPGPRQHARCDHHHTAIYNAPAIKPAVETAAAAAGRICCAGEARYRGCNQSCCKNEFHVFSLCWARHAAPENVDMRFDTPRASETQATETRVLRPKHL
jgi:hypothetical protein